MANIRLDLSQFRASGIYTVEFDNSQSIVINTQTTRLVVGFSKNGPINAPVYCADVKTARTVFGDIDRDLERKGSFFHRSLFTCLETGPCFALNLMPLNDDETTSNPDMNVYKSYSLSTSEANGLTASELYSSYFNKQKFYFPDETYLLADVNKLGSNNAGKVFNVTNLGQTPFSLIVRKTGDLNGFNVTARDWFGAQSQPIPPFIRDFDFISEYFVIVDIVSGDWTNFASLSADPVYSSYFTTKGIIKSQLTAFLNSSYVTRLGNFQGCLIPDLTDNNGVNYSIDTIINAAIATTGLFVAIDREALADYDPTDTTSVGRIDTIGHSLINSSNNTINFLSYNFPCKEYFDYTNQPSYSTTNNTFLFDFGTGATGNLPGGVGSTGATYSALANGFFQNDPSKVAYFTSFYGSGNQGKFNNNLNIREEALSSAQLTELRALTPGTSIALQGAAGATQYATITALNEVTVGSNTTLVLSIAHPNKQFEGTTLGKNSAIIAVGATNMTVGGTSASQTINLGDWVFAQNSGTTYYFRVNAVSASGSSSIIGVDTTNSLFAGSTYLPLITTFYTLYWESVSGAAGSLFDIVSPYINSGITELKTILNPDKFFYVSSTTSTYVGYSESPLYQAFATGILTDGDTAYVAGPTPLYLSASFGKDIDNQSIVTLNAYRDASLTIGYTGAWNFSNMKDSSGATANDLKIYSLVGDYSISIGATGFNSTRTQCYITANDQANVSVGHYLVADPLATGDISDYILTRILAIKKISTGTYSGYYQLTVNQRIADYAGNIVRYRRVDEVAPGYQPVYLPGFKVGSYQLPGNAAQLAKILGLLDPANTNLSSALSSRHIIAFRYIVDTFDGGLASLSYPKNIVTTLAMNRQKCLAIMNAPSIQSFINSSDPRFTDPPTASNPKPLLNTSYIASGGNLSLGPSFTYSLPDEANGSKFAGFFSPFLTLRENNKNIQVPPAADVSNNFIRKFINGQPYSIVAGPRRGILSNPLLNGLEFDFTDDDRANLEPFGWNPIVFRRGVGFMIYGNQMAYQNTPSAFNNLHVRDLLITIEEAIEDILGTFIFEFNDASTRLQISSIVKAFMANVQSGGGVYSYTVVMDETNNTPDIIDQNFAIIDVSVEPSRGMQKFVNRMNVLKTGGVSSGGFTSI